MKTKLLALILAGLAMALTGCTSLLHEASTTLDVKHPSGLEVNYKSPKDQKLNYNPATGEITVESKTNAELAAQAAQAQAAANQATAEVLREIAGRIPLSPGR